MRDRLGGTAILPLILLALVTGACSTRLPLPGSKPPPTFHLTEVSSQGDPERRASHRLLLEGLRHDEAGQRSLARNQYKLAIQLDPGNPYAYLAYARHLAEGRDPARALPYLDKLDGLLAIERAPQGVEAHRVGLRGAALRATGDTDAAAPLLMQARELAPELWSDGHLSAAELR